MSNSAKVSRLTKARFKTCSIGFRYSRDHSEKKKVATHMIRLTRGEVKYEWNDPCERAFPELKRRITSTPILIVPERGQRYTVYCDASKDRL